MPNYNLAAFTEGLCSASFYGLQAAGQYGADYVYQNFIGNPEGPAPHDPHSMASNMARQSMLTLGATVAYYVSRLVVEPAIKGISGVSHKRESVWPPILLGGAYSLIKAHTDLSSMSEVQKLATITGSLATDGVFSRISSSVAPRELEFYDGVGDAMRKAWQETHPITLKSAAKKMAVLTFVTTLNAGIDTAIAKNIGLTGAQTLPLKKRDVETPETVDLAVRNPKGGGGGLSSSSKTTSSSPKTPTFGSSGSSGSGGKNIADNPGVFIPAELKEVSTLTAVSTGAGTRQYKAFERTQRRGDEEMQAFPKNETAPASVTSTESPPPPYASSNAKVEAPPMVTVSGDEANTGAPMSAPEQKGPVTDGRLTPPLTSFTPEDTVKLLQQNEKEGGIQILLEEIRKNQSHYGSLKATSEAAVARLLSPETNAEKLVGGRPFDYQCPVTNGRFVAKGAEILVVSDATFRDQCQVNASGRIERKPMRPDPSKDKYLNDHLEQNHRGVKHHK